jgi:magnesium-transporting ATPase (P-type)
MPELRRFQLVPRAARVPDPAGEQFTADNHPRAFCSNTISTSRYTLLNFLPKNLFEQFRRAANIYFMTVVVLMFIGEYGDNVFDSPLAPWSLFGPLVLIMALTSAKDANEDWKRHVADRGENERTTTVCTVQGETKMRWQDLRVGMLVKVTAGQFFPADLILLQSSSQGGKCYVETASIDGETNLKQKKSPAGSEQIVNELLGGARAGGAPMIECEAHTTDIHHF